MEVSNREKIRRRKASERYREKKRETHDRKLVWIPKPIIEQIEEIATERNWKAKTGRNQGYIDYQYSIVEILKIGIEAIKTKTK